MYSLDINFLNDRPDYKPVVAIKQKSGSAGSSKDQLPLLAGAAFAVAINALVGGAWWWIAQDNARLESERASLEGEVGKLDAQEKEIKTIEDQTQQITQEYMALAGVFDRIKPWSALMQDINSRIPPGVRIASIVQTEPSPLPVPATPPPSASPSPSESGSPSPGGSASPSASPSAAVPTPPAPVQTAKVEISGVANSFDQINDFLLLIQRSPFFRETETRLVAATLKPDRSGQFQLRTQGNTTGGGTTQLPKLRPIVEYKIETSLSPTPASQLLPELRNKQGDGLAIRIETLKEQGVLSEQQSEVKKP